MIAAALVIGTAPLRRGRAELQTVLQMPTNYKPRAQYLAERERSEVAARKAEQEQKSDPLVEQAVIAYVAHRQGGGDMQWDDFRRQWLTEREAMDGR